MGDALTCRDMQLRGRADELAVLLTLVDGVRAGAGGALVVQGDAGLGKTALLDRAARDSAAQRLTVVRSRARRAEAGLAYAGLHALLDAARLTVIASAAATATATANGGTAASSQRCASLDPRLAPAEGGPLTRALSGRSAAVLGVGVELLDLVRAASASQPVLFLIDDAQWLDGPSAAAIGFLAGRLGDAAAGVVLAQRAGGPVWDLPVLQLPRLGRTEGAGLLADVAPELPGDVVAALLQTGAGNPLALLDLVASLSAEQRRGDDEPPVALPPDSRLYRDHLDRIARLTAPSRTLLLLVSADPALTVAELVAGAELLGGCLADLEPAERAGLIRFDGWDVELTDPLLGASLYRAATLRERSAAHGVLARVVDRSRGPIRALLHRAALATEPDPELAAELERAARVLVAGGPEAAADRPIASRALVRAAELSADPTLAAARFVAAARAAWAAGDPHRARALLRRLPRRDLDRAARAQSELLRGEIELRAGGSTRAGQALLAAADELGHDREQRVTAMLRAGEALCLSGDYPDFTTLAERALALRRPDDQPPTQLAYEQFTGLSAMFRGDHEHGFPALRRVIDLATGLDDRDALLRGAMAAIVIGDDQRALQLAHRVATLARADGDQLVVPQALELAAAAECALGHYDDAAVTIAEALPLARATGQESLGSTLLGLSAVLAATVGDSSSCRERGRAAREHGVDRSEALVEWAFGLLDLVQGRPVEAAARLLSLLGMDLGQGQLVIRVAATPHVVEACLRAGEPDAARTVFDIFRTWAEATGNPSWLGLARRCQALISEDPDESVGHFTAAIEHHQAARAEFERARTQLLYGQELRRLRRPAAAREHLRLAGDTFRRFRAHPLAEQAEAELRAAGDHSGHSAPPGILTAQQLQIARLAAGGATNREVAAALFLSTRTVDYHMRNILSRLGIRSRVELVKLLA